MKHWGLSSFTKLLKCTLCSWKRNDYLVQLTLDHIPKEQWTFQTQIAVENHCPILGWWCSWRKWTESFHKNPLDKENQMRDASLSSKLLEQICHNRLCPRLWNPLLLTFFNGGRTYSAIICCEFWQCYTIFIDLHWQHFISASLDHLTWLLHGAHLYILMVLSNSQWSE